MLSSLLDRNADPNYDPYDLDRLNPLTKACLLENYDIVKLLLNADASKDKVSGGYSALSLVQEIMAGAHINFFCDRSGMDPIIGNRYTRNGADLCESEYQKLPLEEQSTRFKPVVRPPCPMRLARDG